MYDNLTNGTWVLARDFVELESDLAFTFLIGCLLSIKVEGRVAFGRFGRRPSSSSVCELASLFGLIEEIFGECENLLGIAL